MVGRIAGTSIRRPLRVLTSGLAFAGLLLLSLAPIKGEESSGAVVGPVTGAATQFDISPPLKELEQRKRTPSGFNTEINPLRAPDLPMRPAAAAPERDPSVQTEARPFAGAAPTPAPLFTVAGLSDDDNASVAGGRIIPPDTEGDIGRDHYVQWINLVFAVWKVTRDVDGHPTGATLDASFGIRAGNSLWSGFGGVCEVNNDGDPIVLYDHLADRWLLSQFSIDEGVQCLAVSTGPDPTGSYYRWAFTVSPGEQNDYPKFGLMPEAYYLSLRDFPTDDGTFAGAVAFDRAALLAGNASPTFVKFSLPCDAGNCPDGIQPPHLEGPVAAAGARAVFTRIWDDDLYGPLPAAAGSDGYRLWEFVPDFTTPGNSTFTELAFLPGAEWDSALCGFYDSTCVAQAGTNQLVDSADELQMYRSQYRHFPGSHDSLLVVTTADATSTDIAGIRWAELRNTGGGWSVFQEGTYSPADGLHRWMGAGAMDAAGNIAIGYSVSSASVFPSIRYATREAADPAGTLPGGEMELQAGAGSQTGGNRWGDYSSMSVDPADGCTFWYTQEYHEAVVGFDFKTRIGAFRLPSCQCPHDQEVVLMNSSPETGTVSVTACTKVTIGPYSVQTPGVLTAKAGREIGVLNGSSLGGTVTLATDPFLALP